MTANKYEFDAVRWCDSMKKAHFVCNDYTTAENFKRTRMRIEELEAAVAELKAMFDDAMQTNHFLEGGISALRAENETLRARVAMLEDALNEISTLYWVDAPAPEEMRRIARRALEEK